MSKKYTVLRFIATTMKVLGIIVAVLTILTALGACATSLFGGAALEQLGSEFGQGMSGIGIFTGFIGAVILAVIPIITGGTLALSLYAFGEVLYVQIDIEENTRSLAWLIQTRFPVQSAPASVPLPYSEPPLVADSSPAVHSFTFCPQCGTRVSPQDRNCPSCNFNLG